MKYIQINLIGKSETSRPVCLEVGMGRPALGPTRCPLYGSWAGHSQEVLFQARIGTSPPRWSVGRPASRTPLSFVFQPQTVKKSKKKQHKTRVRPAGGTSPARDPMGGVVDKILKFQARLDPSFRRAREQARPSPCPGLCVSFPLALEKIIYHLYLYKYFKRHA